MRILYLTRDLGFEKNGANQVMKRNRDAIINIVGDENMIEYYFPKTNIKNVICSLFRMGSYGVTKRMERELLKKVEKIKPDIVFIESSSYGSIYKALSKKNITTICFAHNLDTALCREEIKSRSPLISLPKYISTYLNERKTIKYTDCLICLSRRDSDGFYSTFGRKADCILPITFPAKRLSTLLPTEKTSLAPYFLFVGSDFFPNIEGIKWFITKVAPYIKSNIRIVGSCCSNPALKTLLLPQNVTLVGYADNLDKEYRNAHGVIAPIFKGSGMKTKTIEALRYGKSIFGTDEAFAGINIDFSRIGGKCNTAETFIKALECDQRGFINDYAIEVFNSNFSDEIFTNKLREVINNMIDKIN